MSMTASKLFESDQMGSLGGVGRTGIGCLLLLGPQRDHPRVHLVRERRFSFLLQSSFYRLPIVFGVFGPSDSIDSIDCGSMLDSLALLMRS